MYSDISSQQTMSWPKSDHERLRLDPRTTFIGGLEMSRTLNFSNQSNASTQSQSSDAYYSPISSPPMSEDYTPALPSQEYDGSYQHAYSSYTQSPLYATSSQSTSIKATPSSLGWTPDTHLWKLYKLIVPKGKEPYLELQQGYNVNPNTPLRVYLDPPSNPQKGVFPCCFPAGCSGRQFNRPADLERHYRHVHGDADQKGRFPCDYKVCTRHTDRDPFTRKDHYRDHLKDFHKEDIGTAKQGKNPKGSSKWHATQQAWLAERKIDLRWWRCKKCLQRVWVRSNGYKCESCNEECAQDRIEERERRRAAQGGGGAGSIGQEGYVDGGLEYEEAPCAQCRGVMWVQDEAGGNVMCPACSSPVIGYDGEWDVSMDWNP